jgi:xanthine dehydrogenase accessory factor
MSELLDHVARAMASHRPAALATLVAAKGVTPKKAGATMLVAGGGTILGSVTIGGCVDARVIEHADEVIANGQPRLLTMSLGDEDAWDLGLTCGGTVEVLVQRLDASAPHDPALAAYMTARLAYDSGRASTVAVPLDDRIERLVVDESGSATGTLGDPALDDLAIAAARERLRDERASDVDLIMHSGTPVRIFFERVAPPESVVIYGASQVAMSLVVFARELDMRTVVVDGRERYATRERFPDVDEILVGMPSEIARQLPATPRTYAVLLAHDYKYELPVLRELLGSEVGYIGMLGSRKRGAAIRGMLAEEGFSADQLARIHSPVGLDIGARSAPEIALAIAGEIVSTRQQRVRANEVPPAVAAPAPTAAAR